MLGEFSLLPYSVISAKKNKQSINIHTINNINTITKYKEFKEKKVYLLEMRINLGKERQRVKGLTNSLLFF